MKVLIVEDSQMTPGKYCEPLNKERISESCSGGFWQSETRTKIIGVHTAIKRCWKALLSVCTPSAVLPAPLKMLFGGYT